MAKQKYLCFRYFIVPIDQHLFTQPVTTQKKISWFKEALLVNQEPTLKDGSEFAVRVLESTDDVVYGKISKKKLYKLHSKTPEDIKDITIDDWPYLGFACDLSSNQSLVIQYDSAFIYKVNALKNVLEEIVNPKMFPNGYAVSFEPIVDRSTFWSLIDGSEGVFSITFNLKSPNLFGAESSANEALKKLQGLFNNNKLTVKLENDAGKLNTPKKAIGSYQEYADKGGGDWNLTLRKKNRKRTYKSTERAIKTVISTDDRPLLEILKKAFEEFVKILKAQNEDK